MAATQKNLEAAGQMKARTLASRPAAMTVLRSSRETSQTGGNLSIPTDLFLENSSSQPSGSAFQNQRAA